MNHPDKIFLFKVRINLQYPVCKRRPHVKCSAKAKCFEMML